MGLASAQLTYSMNRQPVITSTSPPLTPFVSETRAAVDQALRALLDIPPALHWSWRDEPQWKRSGLFIVVDVDLPGEGSLSCELSDGQGDQSAWFEGRELHFSHRGEQPESARVKEVLEALRRRIESIDRRGPEEPLLGDLLAAWQRYRRFAVLDDSELYTFSDHEAVIRIGFRCNQDCSFCWQGRTWPSPPYSVLEGWLDEMAELGATKVTFSGGEPTVYPELHRLVARAHGKHGMSVWIQTNAIRLERSPYLDSLVDAGLQGALISYHSADAEVSDAMTRAPGTHRRTEAGIIAALRAGLWVDINGVVEARTLPGLLDRSQRIIEAFAPCATEPAHLGVSFAFPTVYFEPETYRANVAPLGQVSSMMGRAVRTLLEAGIRSRAVGSCGFPLCTLREVPEILDLAVLDELDDKQFANRRHPPTCEPCVLKEHCIGPRREYLDSHGAGGLVPYQVPPAGLGAALYRPQ